jgi:hypothetical protein
LFDEEVPDIKRTIGTPAKSQETFACNWVDEAVVYEKFRELGHDFRKMGCAIDLFLNTSTYGCLDGWTIVVELEELT